MGMLSKFTKLKRNKKFEYSPRYYDDKGKGNPFKMEPKFDKFRTTLNPPRGLKGKFGSALDDMRREGDRDLKIRMVIIIAILVLIVLFILDFDLSIFFPK
ncbi:riboflavin synthase subunit beta [Euzebyella marina]|uniref:Riboflavin synthase subunit beta n=2 Tax=Euzebyella marina TaxID=1761453 RepID=A0A3G2L8A5_9FLAO|nr:riboflavin synthase subunit beta [Euzebyella marina]MAU72635.1 riboflavin synthase subunit beta [Pseudozobellia sp.]MBG50448.1 riboflavin synthase subunit beta [Pseudozobellia sp.]|tara:strand:+ start:212805 stop:213104 length:300 start_codon:yes stop_codon:yes gene_type:complete